MAMFRQEIFRESEKHRTLPGIKSVFPATKTTIDGFRIYQFFAKADSLIHLSHVPRRMPTGGDISSAYQRNLKHAKVNSIGKYLSQRGAFFPNSIVVATESSPTWYKSGGDDVPQVGGFLDHGPAVRGSMDGIAVLDGHGGCCKFHAGGAVRFGVHGGPY